MRSNYKRLGDYITLVDERNVDLKVTTLLGLSISKQFIPSVANIIGTNMRNYKIIRKNQFACSIMQVRRDGKMPVALLKDFEEAIISQAYPIFEVLDTTLLLPEYLMMWFTRSEFDRQATFHAVGGVRGSLEWEDFLDFELPVPSIEIQQEIVDEYHTITKRIQLNEELNQKLEETAQALYKHWFVDFEFPHSPPMEGCPQDGVVQIAHKRNTLNYKSLPYNPKLKDRAKALRKAGNLAEVLFWKQVKNKQFKGLDFDRQKIVGNYIVDFYCANTQTVVEIDGSSHDNKQEYDAERDAYLKELGLYVIHISDTEIKQNLANTMHWLQEHEAFSPPRLSGTPPPEGNTPKGYKSSGGKMVYNEELDKEIPEGWELIPLEYILEEIISHRGKSKTLMKLVDFKSDTNPFPVISAMNINNGKLVKNDTIKYTNEENYLNWMVNPLRLGDIIMTSEAPMGELMYLATYSKYIISQRLFALRPDSIKTSSIFLYFWLQTTEAKRELEGRASGTTVMGIKLSELKKIIVPSPAKRELLNFDNLIIPLMKLIESNRDETTLFEETSKILLSKMATIENEKEMA